MSEPNLRLLTLGSTPVTPANRHRKNLLARRKILVNKAYYANYFGHSNVTRERVLLNVKFPASTKRAISNWYSDMFDYG